MHSNSKAHGFTIVELIVVIVVIAILAAITIVSYVGIQDHAKSAVIQSNFGNAAKQLAIFNLDNSKYPTSATEFRAATDSATWTRSNDPYYWLGYCSNGEDWGLFARQIRTAEWYVVGSKMSLQKSETAGSANATTTCTQLFGIPETGRTTAWIKSGSGWTSAWIN